MFISSGFTFIQKNIILIDGRNFDMSWDFEPFLILPSN